MENLSDNQNLSASSALIVIGNEILSGRTQDKNIYYIAEKMGSHGVPLREVRIVPDIESRIVEAVHSLSKQYGIVFTTGGIGPTHDDITAACIAKAFGLGMERNKAAYEELVKHYSDGEVTEARAKMADMPVGAEIILNPVSGAPGFIIENVYVMAGVPKIMQGMLDHAVGMIEDGSPVLSKTLVFDMPESEIAGRLGEVQDQFPDVEIGSYPNFHNGKLWTSIVARSTDEALLDKVIEVVRSVFEA
ncbi:MAG: competence/damage-inducible protein A [Micavibrio sp.]|nr:competence/damage-inducible protein A [Micavibrio sp.]